MQLSRRSASITALAWLLGVAGCGGGQSAPDAGPPAPAPAPAAPLESDGVLTTLARFGVDLDPSLVVDGQGTAYVATRSAVVAVNALGVRRVVREFAWDPDGDGPVPEPCGIAPGGLSPGPGGLVMFTLTGCQASGTGVVSLTPAGEFAYWDGDYEAWRNDGVTMDAEGSVYVTGTGHTIEIGSVLRVDGPGQRAWRVWFSEDNGLAWPAAPLTAGPDGWVYGVSGTYAGSNTFTPMKVVFRISRAGELQTLYTVAPGDAIGTPLLPGLLVGNDGWITGRTGGGGAHGLGTVWRMRTDGTSVEVLHDFVEFGSGPLLRGADGHLYGTKRTGAAAGSSVLFRLRTDGAYEVLYEFNAADGPARGPLFQPADGMLYGTTARTVFRIVLPR